MKVEILSMLFNLIQQVFIEYLTVLGFGLDAKDIGYVTHNPALRRPHI